MIQDVVFHTECCTDVVLIDQLGGVHPEGLGEFADLLHPRPYRAVNPTSSLRAAEDRLAAAPFARPRVLPAFE